MDATAGETAPISEATPAAFPNSAADPAAPASSSDGAGAGVLGGADLPNLFGLGSVPPGPLWRVHRQFGMVTISGFSLAFTVDRGAAQALHWELGEALDMPVAQSLEADA